MGAMFRSEEMTLCQMFIQPEAGYSSVSELGETGAVQFRDVSILTLKTQVLKASSVSILRKELRYLVRKLELTEILTNL